MTNDPRNTTTDTAERMSDDPHNEWAANLALVEEAKAPKADSLNDTLAAIARSTGSLK